MIRCLACLVLLPALGAQEPPRRTAGADADALATAWLHELLGPDPSAALAGYRAVVEDSAAPREHRVRAAARALPLAAATRDAEEGLWWASRLLELMPARDTATPQALLQRLTAVQDAVRAWASEDTATDTQGERALGQRLAGEPWRSLEAMASRPAQSGEPLERQLRAAEARGDAEEVARLRQQASARRDSDLQRPRLMQLRRWARDILEWELAGQHDKAQRLLATLARRRPGRGPMTLQRLEAEMRAGPRVSPQERKLLERALVVARERAAANDQRGVSALVAPALTLLLWSAD